MWARLGDTPNYVEPCLGSGAMLLARPDAHQWWERIETVNDLDGYVSNFWRAIQSAPNELAHWADWPVNENCLHARHAWLLGRRETLQARLEGDPAYYDAKVAGWWVWGMCAWIGGGWCSGNGPWHVVDGELRKTSTDGNGAKRQRPHLGNAGQGINRRMAHLATGDGQAAAWSGHLRAVMQRLSDRLRRVRVCCGDWSRICGPAPTVGHGLTAVFLDPPYAQEGRDSELYRVEMETATAVRDWAVAHGDNPLYRIALCGYEGEHDMPPSWECVAWKAHGGYSNQGDEDSPGHANAHRERVWFSPHCLRGDGVRQMSLMEEERWQCKRTR